MNIPCPARQPCSRILTKTKIFEEIEHTQKTLYNNLFLIFSMENQNKITTQLLTEHHDQPRCDVA